MCHSRIGMAGVFRQLKELAMERGHGPESVAAAYAEFLSTGALGRPKEGARKKLGLAPLPAGGGDVIGRLLGSADSGPEDTTHTVAAAAEKE